MNIIRRVFRFVQHYKLLCFALATAGIAAVLSLTRHGNLANIALTIVSVVALIPLVVRMVQDLRAGRYGIDILAALAIGTSVVLGQYWAAIIIVIMLSGGKSLEDFATARAQSELKALLKHSPQIAHIQRKKQIVDVKASEVRESDVLVIRPGEIIPVDAIITDGSTTVDEASLTGESLPLPKDIGAQVLSGSVNLEGLITVRALRRAADSQYQQIIRLVTAAAEHPAPFARLADRYSVPFTVIALTIGGMAWILSHQAIRFLEVLVVATPCPLILATPIALIAGMSRASRDGIIIKTGTALEQLAQAKVFAFDKTGTLTYGQPQVQQIHTFTPFSQKEVLSYAAAIEQGSNHVLAAAIKNAAIHEQLKLPKARHVQEIAGRGLEGRLHNDTVIIGRLSLLTSRGVLLPKQFEPSDVAQMATFVAINGKLAGYISFIDTVRSETKTTLELLRQLSSPRFLMVTGDNRSTAAAIAKGLGIDDYSSEALPGDKVRAIEAIKTRPVAFVGDGINDAPVLMAADVGIALGARGSTAASESADVVIMRDDLRYVARAVAIAKRAFQIATQSIFIGIALSIILMFVFATGKFPPVAGALVQEVVDVLVIMNALRAHNPSKLPTIR